MLGLSRKANSPSLIFLSQTFFTIIDGWLCYRIIDGTLTVGKKQMGLGLELQCTAYSLIAPLNKPRTISTKTVLTIDRPTS